MTPQAKNVWFGIMAAIGLIMSVNGLKQSHQLSATINHDQATLLKLKKEVNHQQVEPKIIKKTVKSKMLTMTENANKVIQAQEFMMNHPNLSAKTDGGYRQMQNQCSNLIQSSGWNAGQVWFAFPSANMAHIQFQVESIDGTGHVNCAFEVLDNKTNKLLGLIECRYDGSIFTDAVQLTTQDGANAYNDQDLQKRLQQGVKPQ